MKFGGTSVGRPENWPTILEAARSCVADGKRPFIVCSALAGVSDSLEQLLATVDAGESPVEEIEAIRTRHLDFAAALDVPAESLIDRVCDNMRRLLATVPSDETVPPPLRAEVMATGELLSTRIGAMWLESQGLNVEWRDAQQMLNAKPTLPGASDEQRYLLATASYERDETLGGALKSIADDAAVITQGFIAGNARGELVLLGRGGSDTAAACFAARLNANRLEIWTDVPGMFTTNPQEVPNARLLKTLSYDEAETLAGMGAKVLHPHCIHPVRDAAIPLHIRWTAQPDVEGTIIEAALTDHADGVKAVSARKSLTLISMEKRAGWQPVGFMADVAACFKNHALSIDLLSSSSSDIRATLDLSTAPEIEEKIPALCEDLRQVCRPQVYENVASVCLVGHAIRGTIHELAPMIGALREQNLLMLTQAANDLTFSFVVPEAEMTPLVNRLHEILFDSWEDDHFGPTWAELNVESYLGTIDHGNFTVAS